MLHYYRCFFFFSLLLLSLSSFIFVPSPFATPHCMYVRNHPVEVTVYSPGSKMAEVICNVKCGLDGTMMLTDTGRLFACGRWLTVMWLSHCVFSSLRVFRHSNQDNKLGLNRRETFIMQMRKILNKVSMGLSSPWLKRRDTFICIFMTLSNHCLCFPCYIIVFSPLHQSLLPLIFASLLCNLCLCGVQLAEVYLSFYLIFPHSSYTSPSLYLHPSLFYTLLSPSLIPLSKERQLQVTSMSVPTPLKELGKHRVVDMSLGPTHSTVLAELGRVRPFNLWFHMLL